jgi:hypothetical protein
LLIEEKWRREIAYDVIIENKSATYEKEHPYSNNKNLGD